MKVLIAILSCHAMADRRVAQRRTWLTKEVHFRYFMGRPSFRSLAHMGNVYLDCGDDYRSLCEKVVWMARWAFDAGYDHVFKCDDDTYVRFPELMRSGFEQHDYSGFIEDRDCHERAFNFPVYPHAAGGPGYWLSREAMRIVASGLPAGQYAEDFAVGEALAKAGINAFHDARYIHDDRTNRDDVLSSDFISLHKCNPQEMRRVHAHLTSFSPGQG